MEGFRPARAGRSWALPGTREEQRPLARIGAISVASGCWKNERLDFMCQAVEALSLALLRASQRCSVGHHALSPRRHPRAMADTTANGQTKF